MKYKRLIWILLIICFTLVFYGCTNNSNTSEKEEEVPLEIAEKKQTGFGEDSRLYDQVERDSVVTFYMTISEKNDTTFFEFDNWYNIHDSSTESPKLDILIQEGTEEGLKDGDFGFDETDVNASIQLRGKSTRVAAQKSYKIKFSDSAGLWQGQKSLNLNKHPYEATRVRNKLSFDYFTLIPNLTSMRTQFVHLYVKDLTDKQSNGQFVDYGLYTHIEQANERFLASHGLDPNGNLYKATSFEFFRYPEQLKLETDPTFDKKAFESILESKGSKDHDKLLTMLDDVNDYSLNIDQVVNRHFDRDNYLTWMATNIIMGNQDVTTQNYYLYSPVNSEKWYFLPWDYDGAWRSSPTVEEHSKTGDWQRGLSNYWNAVLHKRFLKNPKNVEALTKKIEEVAKIINPKQTKKFLDEYYPVVSEFVKRSPDKDGLDIDVSDYEKAYYAIVNESELNKEIYHKNLEKPMPFFLHEVPEKGEQILFEWDPSFDIQGDEITYTWQLSEDPAFSKIVEEQKDLKGAQTMAKSLKPGEYFWRVIAVDAKGNKQMAFDEYEDEDGIRYFGIKKILIQ